MIRQLTTGYRENSIVTETETQLLCMNDAEQCKMNASQTLVFVKNYEDQIFQCTYNVPNCKDHTNFQGNMKMFDLNILGISECRWVDGGRKYLSNDNIHVIFFLAEMRNHQTGKWKQGRCKETLHRIITREAGTVN